MFWLTFLLVGDKMLRKGSEGMKINGKIKDMTLVSVGAVLLCITAWITIPFAVPFTLQTFGVAFVLFAFGGKRGALAIAVYISLGLIGVPVFSGFNSGFGVFLGATGGYIIGFVLWGCLYLALESLFLRKYIVGIAVQLFGLMASYALGTVWYAVWCGSESLWASLAVCVFPYVIPDVIKIILAYAVARRVKRALGN